MKKTFLNFRGSGGALLSIVIAFALCYYTNNSGFNYIAGLFTGISLISYLAYIRPDLSLSINDIKPNTKIKIKSLIAETDGKKSWRKLFLIELENGELHPYSIYKDSMVEMLPGKTYEILKKGGFTEVQTNQNNEEFPGDNF